MNESDDVRTPDEMVDAVFEALAARQAPPAVRLGRILRRLITEEITEDSAHDEIRYLGVDMVGVDVKDLTYRYEDGESAEDILRSLLDDEEG